MYIDKTESELINKLNSISSTEFINYLMEEGLQLKADKKAYDVSLIFEVEAYCPEDAVKGAIQLIECDSLWNFEYSVTDIITGKTKGVCAHTTQEED